VIAIADYGMGNRRSVEKALAHVGAASVVTDDVRDASAIILPGVGAFPEAMRHLERTGLGEQLIERAAAGVPLLGICLGMQLLFERSDEGDTACLGIIPAPVTRFEVPDGLPVPHMGWNTMNPRRESPLTRGVDRDAYVYFVHSFVAPVGSWTVATTTYGGEFSAVVAHRNFLGAQFHPERSSRVGSRVLANFLELDPACS